MDRHEPTAQSTNSNDTDGFLKRTRRAFETRGGKAAVITAIMMGSLSLAACSGGETHGTDGEPVATASAEPSPSETPKTADEILQEKIEAAQEREHALYRGEIPAELVKYEEMSIDDFRALSKSEQWIYASWLTNNRTEYMAADTNDNTAGQAVVLNESSSIEDMIKDYNWTIRMGEGLSAEAPSGATDSKYNGTLDTDAFQKLAIASSIVGGGREYDEWLLKGVTEIYGGNSIVPSAADSYSAMVDAQDGAYGPYAAYPVHAASMSFSTDGIGWEINQEETKTHPIADFGQDTSAVVGNQYTEVVYTDVTGTTKRADFELVKITNYKGETEYRALSTYTWSPADGTF